MQLTTVGKEILKGARQAQQLEAAGSNDPKVAERLRKIKLVETLREAKKDWKKNPRAGRHLPQHLLRLEKEARD